MLVLAAEALKLLLLTPFLVGKTAEDFQQGANFAVSRLCPDMSTISGHVYRHEGVRRRVL